MTPEDALATLKDALTRIADLDDGNINALLKANQVAREALKSIRPLKKVTITLKGDIDPDLVESDITESWIQSNIQNFLYINVEID